jgi:HSP20 family protein
VASKRQDEDWFFHIGEELQRLSDEVMKGVVASSMAARRYWRPNLDVCETSDEVTVTWELAGVEPKDVSIQYVPKTRSLIVRGFRRSIELPGCQPSRSHQLEVYYGEFEREVRLPELSYVPEQIRTSFDNGMLIVRIPKDRVGETVTEKNG